MSTKPESRIAWLDVARICAIMSVVLCHATESTYTLNLEQVPTWNFLTRWFVFSLFTIGRLGVPIFFFLSGYLLLDRVYDNEKCLSFWKNKLLPLLISAEIWIVLINLFLKYFRNVQLNMKHLLLQMLFLEKVNMGHMWYLPVIVGMYIFLPFFSYAIRNFKLKTFMMPFTVAVVYLFGVPLLKLLLKAWGYDVAVNVELNLNYFGAAYGVYMFIGFLFKKKVFDKVKTAHLYLGLVLFFVMAVMSQIYLYSKQVRYNIWYDSPFLLVASVCLFALFYKNRIISVTSWIKRIAICSFGIYLVHRPVQFVLIKYINVGNPWKLFVLWIISFIISWLIVEVINKIPKLGRLLFLIQ